MKTTRQRDQDSALRDQDKKLADSQREDFDAAIAEKVVNGLGVPEALIQVQVRRLWEDRYRVNIFVGPDITSATIVNSFFLIADSNGDISEVTPKIVKQYSQCPAKTFGTTRALTAAS